MTRTATPPKKALPLAELFLFNKFSCAPKGFCGHLQTRETNMKPTTTKTFKQDKLIFRVCHSCGFCNETPVEPERCSSCEKAFLPLNYFEKVHASGAKSEKFQDLFETGSELDEQDLIKGLYVLW